MVKYTVTLDITPAKVYSGTRNNNHITNLKIGDVVKIMDYETTDYADWRIVEFRPPLKGEHYIAVGSVAYIKTATIDIEIESPRWIVARAEPKTITFVEWIPANGETIPAGTPFRYHNGDGRLLYTSMRYHHISSNLNALMYFKIKE